MVRKKVRIIFLSIFFVFCFSQTGNAEEYVVESNKGIEKIWPISHEKYGKFNLMITHIGKDGYVSNPSSQAATPEGGNMYAFTSCTWHGGAVKAILSGDLYKLKGVKVQYCDGTTSGLIETNFPPPPDPPDEGEGSGGNTPPSGGNLPPTKDWGSVDNSKPANACGGGRWTSPIRNWVDNIFCPIITFLDLARSKLAAVSLMMGQGLNIGQYFKIFGDLPTSWQLVVSSLLLMVATLGGLLIFRSAMRIYYSIKEGVKWW